MNAHVNNAHMSLYPRLMKAKTWDFLVMFHANRKGIVVAEGKSTHAYHTMGTYQTCWDMDAFEDFKGSVLLSN